MIPKDTVDKLCDALLENLTLTVAISAMAAVSRVKVKGSFLDYSKKVLEELKRRREEERAVRPVAPIPFPEYKP